MVLFGLGCATWCSAINEDLYVEDPLFYFPLMLYVFVAGFRITACAATPDQAAFVLSVPRRRPMDETQETLRTSAFPSTHVKDKWAKNLYIAGVAYGRTVS